MLRDSHLNVTVFFYNPNIDPVAEYEKRKAEVIRFATKLNIAFVDADYEPDVWSKRVKGLEQEPERGLRCQKCFDLRMERTAHFAQENGFAVFATTLAASRWKDQQQVNTAGLLAAQSHPGLTFWAQDWRKAGGSQLMETISRQENFYRQKYCGCCYSLQNLPTH